MSLPQLDTTVYLGQVFWLACSIVVVFCIMRFFTVPKMEKFFFKPIVDSEKIVDIILNVDKKIISMRGKYQTSYLKIHQETEKYKKNAFTLLDEKFDKQLKTLKSSSSFLKENEAMNINTDNIHIDLNTAYIYQYLKKPMGY